MSGGPSSKQVELALMASAVCLGDVSAMLGWLASRAPSRPGSPEPTRHRQLAAFALVQVWPDADPAKVYAAVGQAWSASTLRLARHRPWWDEAVVEQVVGVLVQARNELRAEEVWALAQELAAGWAGVAAEALTPCARGAAGQARKVAVYLAYFHGGAGVKALARVIGTHKSTVQVHAAEVEGRRSWDLDFDAALTGLEAKLSEHGAGRLEPAAAREALERGWAAPGKGAVAA